MAGEVATLPAEALPIPQVEPTFELIADPQLKSLIPPLSDSEYAALRDNISKDGCREPLTIWKDHNIILDGHNRYQICKELNLSFKVVEIELPDLTAVKIWMIKNQRGRRNLNESQRAMLAVKLAALYAEQAKERKGTRTDLHEKNLAQGEFGRSVEKAAKDMGVSHITVSYAKRVSKKGSPELIKLAESGKVAVSAAAKVTSLDHQLQAKVVERVETKIKEGKHPKIGAIINEIAPKVTEDSSEKNLEKVSKNLKACLKLLGNMEVVQNQKNLAEMQEVIQKIAERLRVIGVKSPDPSTKSVLKPSDDPLSEIQERSKETDAGDSTIWDEESEPESESAEEFYSDSKGADLPEGWEGYQKAMEKEIEESAMHGEY